MFTFWSALLTTLKTSNTVLSSLTEMLADFTVRPRLLRAPVMRSSRLCWSGPVMVTTVDSESDSLSKSMYRLLLKSMDAVTSTDAADAARESPCMAAMFQVYACIERR